jgi:catechol 2,3-dioxygenase-like lactoylglutathione lyase family enzyme
MNIYREGNMLGNKEAIATIGVKDIEAARKFYGGKLGLKQEPSTESGVLVCKSGSSQILIYQSAYAGTNKATVVTWAVGDDVQGVVQSLRSKGISFEHYDLPETTREGDVHLSGKIKAAWFKDPDGNILALVNQ